ncbi:hypothetical protein D3C78_1240760 [compost metagenome]
MQQDGDRPARGPGIHVADVQAPGLDLPDVADYGRHPAASRGHGLGQGISTQRKAEQTGARQRGSCAQQAPPLDVYRIRHGDLQKTSGSGKKHDCWR